MSNVILSRTHLFSCFLVRDVKTRAFPFLPAQAEPNGPSAKLHLLKAMPVVSPRG